MKRITSLLILTAMCLSLGACSNDVEDQAPDNEITETEEKAGSEYAGIWKYYDFNGNTAGTVNFPVENPSFKASILDLKKNGKLTFTYSDGGEVPGTWEYSKDDHAISVTMGGGTQKYNIIEENGLTMFVNKHSDLRFFLCLEPDSEIEEKYHVAAQRILYSTSEYDAKYFYDLLTELGDYKNSKEYLSKINLYPNMLRKIKKVTTDAFGQADWELEKWYSYDKNGECYDFSEAAKIAELLGYTDFKFTFTYDDSGVMNGAYLGSEGDISLKVQIECDANGNITTAHFMDREGSEWTNTYAYNDDGLLIEANIGRTDYSDSEGYIYRYEYDQNENLVMETMSYTDYDVEKHYKHTIHTYDENGLLITSERYTGASLGEDGTYTGGDLDYKEIYSYNENGDISTVDVKEYWSNGEIHEEYVLEYVYEDIYMFNRD